MEFEKLLEIAQQAVTEIFEDDEIGKCVRGVLEEGFEETEEVLEDLEEYDQCTIISDTSSMIVENENDIQYKYKWNESSDQRILHQLLLKIFKEKVMNLDVLISYYYHNVLLFLLQNLSYSLQTMSFRQYYRCENRK